MFSHKVYYFCKKLMPRWLQIVIRRRIANRLRCKCEDIWPINQKSKKCLDNFKGWPDDKQFVFLLRHDVETKRGYIKYKQLLNIDKEFGLKASFNFVPKRYDVLTEDIENINRNGFEVGVHGLKHDGRLYMSRKLFNERANKINEVLMNWQSVGFYSPSAHHKLNWLEALNVLYDSSTFDTDPFEPQPDAVETIFPFNVHCNSNNNFIEIPYTLPQDFTLFVILKEKDIDIWVEKCAWIAKHNGVVFLNTHPDYMRLDKEKPKINEYDVNLYIKFLDHLTKKYKGQFWQPLPRELAMYWLNQDK